ncbi:MAG: hypothetical protein ABEL76_15125, partial [Bradymonadaceae bacterium]
MSVSDPGSTLAERLHRVPDLGARTRRRAAEFLDAGEPARAADLLLEEATAPTSPRRRIYAARLYLSADAPDSALDALTSDPGQYPDALRVDYWLVRARSHAGCDERTEAAESVERARRAGASAERVASIERRLEAVPSPPSAGGDTPAPRGAGDPEETTPPDLPSESDDADEEVIELDGEQLRDALLEENDEPGTTGNFRDFADPSDPAGEFYEDVDDTVIDRGSPMTREGEPDEAVAPTGEFEGESTKNWDPEQADDSTFAASNMPDTLIDHDVLQRSSGEAVDAGDAATEPPASDPSDGPTDAGSSEGAAGQASASVAAG